MPSDNKHTIWVCNMCHADNIHTDSTCAVCNYPRSREATHDQDSARHSRVIELPWVCDTCHANNPQLHTRCAVCDEPRGISDELVIYQIPTVEHPVSDSIVADIRIQTEPALVNQHAPSSHQFHQSSNDNLLITISFFVIIVTILIQLALGM
jgi:ribosomal protein L37E